jgi:hypothetical protein
MSSYELLKTLCEELGALPLSKGSVRARIRIGCSIAHADVEAIEYAICQVDRVDCVSVADIYRALDRAKTVCCVAMMAGTGFQGPLIGTDIGRFAIVSVDVDPDSGLFPVVFNVERI